MPRLTSTRTRWSWRSSKRRACAAYASSRSSTHQVTSRKHYNITSRGNVDNHLKCYTTLNDMRINWYMPPSRKWKLVYAEYINCVNYSVPLAIANLIGLQLIYWSVVYAKWLRMTAILIMKHPLSGCVTLIYLINPFVYICRHLIPLQVTRSRGVWDRTTCSRLATTRTGAPTASSAPSTPYSSPPTHSWTASSEKWVCVTTRTMNSIAVWLY